MAKLILIRHGESRWNLENRFTGWVDVPLSEKGIEEAKMAADEIAAIDIDVAFTSELWRAQQTLGIILSKQKKSAVMIHNDANLVKMMDHLVMGPEIPVYFNRALNERQYGDLQGYNKQEMVEKYGADQVHIWRRSFDIQPPNGESLKDTCERAIPYFLEKILPEIKAGKNVIVAAHGNSLRAIIKHLENISETEIPGLELATGKPRNYEYSAETDTFKLL